LTQIKRVLPRDFGYSYMKSQCHDCCGVPLLRQGDNVIEGGLEKAEALNKQFTSVFTGY